jgi:hypothetical protein
LKLNVIVVTQGNTLSLGAANRKEILHSLLGWTVAVEMSY